MFRIFIILFERYDDRHNPKTGPRQNDVCILRKIAKCAGYCLCLSFSVYHSVHEIIGIT